MTVDFSHNLLEPTLPETGLISVSRWKDEYEELKVVEYVEKMNLQYCTGDLQTVFQGIVTEEDVARGLEITLQQAEFHLNLAAFCSRIGKILLEKTHSLGKKTGRKVSGYISMKPSAVQVLSDRILEILEKETGKQLKNQSLEQMQTFLLANPPGKEGTAAGRLTRFFLALIEIRRKTAQISLYGSRSFYDVMQRRAWRILEIRSQNYNSDEASSENRSAEQNDKNPDGFEESASKEPGEGGFPAAEAGKRAEDLAEWRELEKKQNKDNIDWDMSFRALGPFMTVRILLRRHLFSEILRWLESDHSGCSDLKKIHGDCLVTLTALTEQKADPQEIAQLEEILSILEKDTGLV